MASSTGLCGVPGLLALLSHSRTVPRVSKERKLIAQMAEVSVHTVNAYFSSQKRNEVTAITRERIQQAADKLGYQPSSRATVRPWRDRKTVGYQVPRAWDVGQIDNVVFARLFIALHQEAERRGMRLLAFAAPIPEAPNNALPFDGQRSLADVILVRQLEQAYRSGTIDGFIFDDPVVGDHRLRHAQTTGIPYVVTGDPVEDDPTTGRAVRPSWAEAWPCVDVDDRAGFHDLVVVMSAVRGHRHLLHVGFAPDGTFPGVRRASGVADAVNALQLSRPVYLPVGYSAKPADAVRMISAALQAQPDVTGVICDCDRFAFHALLAAHSLKRRIVVAGCDDEAVRRSWPQPWLSLAGVPTTRAAATVQLLVERMTASAPTVGTHPVIRIPPVPVGLTGADRRKLKQLKIELKVRSVGGGD